MRAVPFSAAPRTARAHPRPASPLKAAVLTTRRAPGLDALLAHPSRGRVWDVAVVVATDPTFADRPAVSAASGPVLVHDFAAFTAARGAAPRDLALRAEFDDAMRRLLAPFRPDLVVLCGYLHIVTPPLLDAFPDRVVNLHDADLCVRGPDGMPRFRGLRSTRDAILAGEPATRTTVHLVTPDVDTGPPILRSWPFPTHPLVEEARAWGATDILKAYAYAQREWMMRASWAPLVCETLAHFARGEVRRLGDRILLAGRAAPRDLDPPAPASSAAVARRPAPGSSPAAARAAGGA